MLVLLSSPLFLLSVHIRLARREQTPGGGRDLLFRNLPQRAPTNNAHNSPRCITYGFFVVIVPGVSFSYLYFWTSTFISDPSRSGHHARRHTVGDPTASHHTVTLAVVTSTTRRPIFVIRHIRHCSSASRAVLPAADGCRRTMPNRREPWPLHTPWPTSRCPCGMDLQFSSR